MTVQPEVKSNQVVDANVAFPQQQSVVMPGTGNGNISLYLSGSPGSQIAVYFSGGAQVLYGQNFGAPNTPLPVGVSTYPLANGFNIAWQSSGQPFKLVWGTQ